MNDTLLHMFLQTYENHPQKIAFIYRVLEQKFEITYAKLFEDVLLLSKAFRAKNIRKNSKVMFVCDNRYEWMVSDLALISLGAISVPRGSDTPSDELAYIIQHSGCEFLIIESLALYTQHKEILKQLPLKSILIVEAPHIHTLFANTYSYNDILKDRTISPEKIKIFYAQADNIASDDIFTLIYTSGTTGRPKGVILTHKNIMHNVHNLPKLIDLVADDVWVSILPSWHIFERAAEYLSLSKGCTTIYASIKTFASDLEEFKPTLVATVPRLWESMYTKINATLEKQNPKKAKIFTKLVAISASYNYNLRILKDELPRFDNDFFIPTCKKFFALCTLIFLFLPNAFAKSKLALVKQKFGGRLRIAISGGGTLPEYLDKWIDAVGIRISNAYGMSECAPGIAGRALNCQTFGTLGLPVDGTSVKIVDEFDVEVKVGEVGEILVKGDQLTQGYYNNERENEKSFTKDGYFRTGDLGKFTIKKELIITGRSKEIIVLANGENVDPSRIEATISMLPFITDSVLVGQDKKGLGILIVADFDKLKEYVSQHFDKAINSMENILEDQQIISKIKHDMNELLHYKKGFKPFEKLQNIHFLSDEFKPGVELTNTLKKKRHVIEQKYKEVIDKFLH
ncbi:MAG: long-chain fatty acid--CoA ligase [Sulfurospirillum sp.]|nr:long-chain fatty acid--CoA ligase [Sulfurospirillum sp.]